LLRNELLLYSDTPLRGRTTYFVRLQGERRGESFHLDWRFTTE
jgi:hypothetical protein